MRYRFAALSACLAVMASAGVATAQPANGTCSLALPAQWVFPGTGGVINQSAADLTGWTFSGAACAGSSGGVVYYNFTPATAGPWRLSTCATLPTFDTVLSIHTGCPANTTNYATGAAATSCNDTGTGCAGDTSTFDTTALTPGTTYVIRLARWNSTTVPTGGVRVDVTNLAIPTSCCNAVTGACTVATSATSCPAGTTALTSANGVCSPNPCPQPPANDLCAAAIVIPATALPVNASVTGSLAAAQPTTALAPAVCATSSRDVFYSYTPVDSGAYTITTCNTVTGTLDTVVSVHSACPADGSTLISGLCSDDNCTGGVGPSTVAAAPLSAGTTYIIRVARWGTGNPGGPFRLDITTGAFGACCDTAAGTCQLQSQTACASPLVFQGDATTCTVNPCLGTCCNPTSGACSLTGSTGCASPNVFTPGPGATCSPNPCPQPPPPANDECTAATVVALGTPAAGIISNATGSDITSCSGSDVDVWFVFTPAASGLFNVTATPATAADDALALTAFDFCPPTTDSNQTGLACAAQPGAGTPTTVTVSGAAGSPLYIRAGAFTGDTGSFSLTVTAAIGGACCNNTTGACTISTTGSAGCGTTATYQGDNTTCSPSPCPASGTCCNPSSGACTVTIEALCASPSTWTSGGVCVPNPCPQPPPPANDECTAATVLALNTPAAGLVTNATGSDITTCSGSDIDVWFVFTPASSGAFSVTATPTSATDAGLALTAFDACPPLADTNQTGLGCVAQPGDGTVTNIVVTGTAGQPLYIRAGAFFGDLGSFSITIVSTTAGACCNTTSGACTVSTTGAAGCVGGTYQGDNTACTPSPCPASGTCCNAASGGCTITVEAACASPNTWTSGAVCTPNPCPQPPPPANDDCSGAIALQLNVAAAGNNAQATGDGTEGPGGDCYTTSPTNFNKAVWYTFTAPANAPYGFTACGSEFDTVLSVYDGTCTAFGTELGCDDDTCDGITPPGSGAASIIAPINLTQGQTYLVRIASWGTISGAFTLTATGTPVVTSVVCCRGVTCAVVADSAACTAPAGVGIRVLPTSTTSCAGQAAINAGCCYADFNKSGVKDVADIFAYLSAWFANSTYADVGGDGTGTRDVSDIFQFLSAWFAGCT